MATEEKIRIFIDGNSKGAITAIQQTQGAFSNLMKVFGVGMLAGGGIAIAQKGFQMLETSIRGTINFLKSSIEEASNAERQLTKLNTALQSTGHYTEAGSKELQDYADALQRTTRFEDDAVVSVEAMLATFKLNNEEIKIATQATLDLAAATDQDLQSAAILMGKAMVGEVGMLKRYGIMVDEAKFKAEGWKAVIEEINIEFGGQAQAQANDYLGIQDRLKNTFSDLKETIGNAFLPTLKNLATEFFNVGGGAEDLQVWASKAAEKIKGFLETLMGADWQSTIGGLQNIGKALLGLITGHSSFEMTDQKAQQFANTLGKLVNNIAGFLTAIDLTVQSLKIMITLLDMLIVGPGEAFKNSLENFKLSLQGNKDAILQNNAEFLNWEKEITKLSEQIHQFIETGNIFNKVTTQGADILNNKVSPGLEKTAASADHARVNVANLIKVMAGLTDKKITITTEFDYIGSPPSGTFLGLNPSNNQSGGTIRRDQYITDLGIRAVKGEGIIPAPLMKAIKEGWGSFAGVSTGTKSKGDIYVQIYGDQFFSSNMDTENWTTEVANQIKRKSAGVGS